MMKNRFVLITRNGTVMVFTVRACAELYQQINGGTICGDRCKYATNGGLTIARSPV